MSEIDRYRTVARMRAFEEAVLAAAEAGDVPGELHLAIGQEGVAAGMAEGLRPGDAVVSTHRAHLHALAKGVEVRDLLAELLGRETGICRGRGGHQHIYDPASAFACTGIVGAALPIALGYANAAALRGDGSVAVGITGDGGVQTGAFHETLSIATAWELPLVVLIENNEYAISVPLELVTATDSLAERAVGYGAWGLEVDGTDVAAMAAAFAAAVEHARSGAGPAVLEATCHRFRGHYEGDMDLYRSEEQKEEARRHGDPLAIAAAAAVAAGAVEAELDEIYAAERRALDALIEELKGDPEPDPATAREPLFVD